MLGLQLMLAIEKKVDGYVAFGLYLILRFWIFTHFIMYFNSSMFRLDFVIQGVRAIVESEKSAVVSLFLDFLLPRGPLCDPKTGCKLLLGGQKYS